MDIQKLLIQICCSNNFNYIIKIYAMKIINDVIKKNDYIINYVA